MIEIGRYNRLKVVKEVSFGLYLDGDNEGEILLPTRYVPKGCQPGDEVDVFIYFDSDDRIIATTETPYAQVGEFALLRAKSVDQFGAFLDWGLMKDLLVPFKEQRVKMMERRSYIVYVYFDVESQRIVASAKLNKFLNKEIPVYAPGQEVDLLIESETDLGFKAIVNNCHWGILYENEVFEQLDKGMKIKGYVKKIREDKKIDLQLHPFGYQKVDSLAESILEQLRQSGGFLPISDKSSAEEIYREFGISKKTFKQAIGQLYKKRLIIIENMGIAIPKG